MNYNDNRFIKKHVYNCSNFASCTTPEECGPGRYCDSLSILETIVAENGDYSLQYGQGLRRMIAASAEL